MTSMLSCTCTCTCTCTVIYIVHVQRENFLCCECLSGVMIVFKVHTICTSAYQPRSLATNYIELYTQTAQFFIYSTVHNCSFCGCRRLEMIHSSLISSRLRHNQLNKFCFSAIIIFKQIKNAQR